jgi:hypothetical protein
MSFHLAAYFGGRQLKVDVLKIPLILIGGLVSSGTIWWSITN